MKTLATVLLTAFTAFTLACGYSSKPTTPATAGSLPTITILAPTNATHGDPAFVLMVTGTNFSTTAVINFNGVAETTNQVSATQLTATIPASQIETAGTVQVTITNPAVAGTGAYGSGGTLAETSVPMNFTVD
ncbi:MAG: IPT/TIG domain-containing protein [Candidatus Sulfotelmatobacter sp.]